MMDIIVKVQPSNIQFNAVENVTILESALKSGVILEHSCKNGSCGLCSSQLISGEVTSQEGETFTSGQSFLTCQCKPSSNKIIIEAEYYPELAGIVRKVTPCKISSIDKSAQFAIFKFRLPPTAAFKYLPGQYINLSYQGVTRSYSIANADSNDGIELHIRRVPDGVMSELLFSDVTVNSLLRMDGPIGTFFVRPDTKPIVFLAGGTGFAPVKAMVESLIAQESSRDISIYWGMNSSKDFYSDLPIEWASKFKNVKYIPVVSGDDYEWNGRKGLVHKAVIEDIQDMSNSCVYACGSPQMIAAAKQDFILSGLLEKQFFSDAFTASK
ncbi:2Fe-2S iron-sulfur cluster binding domain-containing protein [Aeromonas veronii]|uniref:FAD-binding oxidoreductase n=1 Tax=Aeromonas veronii TaxID=654 RepID=UPI001F3035EF|nr:FAD-binding oxidoreductase [Aeromonas veronii]MCF5846484.1 2Fe-2S iron-sulfur cluster binding domain-containing protein [Aeromonas veronii]